MFYNLHLESRGGRNIRIAQVSETVEDVRRYAADLPIVLAGDLNLDLSRSIFSPRRWSEPDFIAP